MGRGAARIDIRGELTGLRRLPLGLDMGGGVGLRADGEIVAFSSNEPESLRVVTDEQEALYSLVIGARRYPALAKLIPDRPTNALACTACGGSGRHPSAVAAGIDRIDCVCAGLGWLRPS